LQFLHQAVLSGRILEQYAELEVELILNRVEIPPQKLSYTAAVDSYRDAKELGDNPYTVVDSQGHLRNTGHVA
jgi:hypothetical protein